MPLGRSVKILDKFYEYLGVVDCHQLVRVGKTEFSRVCLMHDLDWIRFTIVIGTGRWGRTGHEASYNHS